MQTLSLRVEDSVTSVVALREDPALQILVGDLMALLVAAPLSSPACCHRGSYSCGLSRKLDSNGTAPTQNCNKTSNRVNYGRPTFFSCLLHCKSLNPSCSACPFAR